MVVLILTFVLGMPSQGSGEHGTKKDKLNLTQLLTAKSESNGIMAQAIYLREDLLKEQGDTTLLKRIQKEGLIAFRIFLNTHSSSVDFTKYNFNEKPFLSFNGESEVLPFKWEPGESGMPSHHLNGVLFFKKKDIEIKKLDLVLPELSKSNLILTWDFME